MDGIKEVKTVKRRRKTVYLHIFLRRRRTYQDAMYKKIHSAFAVSFTIFLIRFKTFTQETV